MLKEVNEQAICISGEIILGTGKNKYRGPETSVLWYVPETAERPVVWNGMNRGR